MICVLHQILLVIFKRVDHMPSLFWADDVAFSLHYNRYFPVVASAVFVFPYQSSHLLVTWTLTIIILYNYAVLICE